MNWIDKAAMFIGYWCIASFVLCGVWVLLTMRGDRS